MSVLPSFPPARPIRLGQRGDSGLNFYFSECILAGDGGQKKIFLLDVLLFGRRGTLDRPSSWDVRCDSHCFLGTHREVMKINFWECVSEL